MALISTKNGVLENNRNVNYVQQGEGAPLIFAHGLAASLHDWDELLPNLTATGFTGYALDLLGHGESHKPLHQREYTFKAVFDHFEGWIDSLQTTEPMILVGHSLGGGLSLQYAIRHPERVRALILINPFYELNQLPQALRFAFRRQLFNTAMLEYMPYRVFRFLVDMNGFNYYIAHRETHILPEHVRYQTALDYKRAASGIYNILSTFPDLTSDLARVQQPTLLMWGKRDQTLAPESFPRIVSLLPNIIASHTMPICGHVPHQCHPDSFNPHVLKFLSDLQTQHPRV